MILAVGYRVRSHRGTQFRRWATELLREYVVKGFVLDDERLKEGRSLGTDYFDELLERIREIRASEKRFYQKIRDLYALAIDYDASTTETKEFFQVVQNKLHWAITGSTAAEIIAKRADAEKPNMGLTTWKGGKVRRADVTVAKNYLNDGEIRQLCSPASAGGPVAGVPPIDPTSRQGCQRSQRQRGSSSTSRPGTGVALLALS